MEREGGEGERTEGGRESGGKEKRTEMGKEKSGKRARRGKDGGGERGKRD